MKCHDLSALFGFPAAITWDPDAQAIYLQVSDEPVGYTACTGDPVVNIDLSREDTVVGVEILL